MKTKREWGLICKERGPGHSEGQPCEDTGEDGAKERPQPCPHLDLAAQPPGLGRVDFHGWTRPVIGAGLVQRGAGLLGM